MIDKQRCVDKAVKLGSDNYAKYANCAQATFTAIVDALREEGVELTNRHAEEAIFNALTGVSGGHANLGCGNCGALTGAAAAISLASSVDRPTQELDKNCRWIAFDNVAKTIGAKFKEEFYGLTCRHVTWQRYGKLWDIWNPAINDDFINYKSENGFLTSEKSTISMVSGWGVGYVIDILDKPRTLEQVRADHNLA